MIKRLSYLLLGVILLVPVITPAQQSADDYLEWPEVTNETKPWSRWWWQGNAVTEEDLTRSMERYAEAGLGGLEITPIYGVHGYEDLFIEYLSSQWMDRLEYTLTEADRLNLGIDMATGTGWPFGGQWINQEHACKYLAHKTYELRGGETLDEPVEFIQEPMAHAVRNRINIEDIKKPISANENLQALALAQIRFEEPLPLQTLMAFSDEDTLDLTGKVTADGTLDWTAPQSTWTLYTLFQGWHGKMVERAAPGGEGNVIDHFSDAALEHYLSKFDEAFEGRNTDGLRGFFNDSYEVDDASGDADFTPEFFEEFESRKGYDLRRHLPDLFAEEPSERTIRLITDYRDVISDLLLEEFTQNWDAWAKEQDAIVRNQAHGSPASILDLYAATDIPETEGRDVIRFKFASSAAHVTGKPLASAEAATWLNEHFQSSLSDVKTAVDEYFLGGVNHIVYHGTPYSLDEADWPGWLFYAAVHFGPTNSFWTDFPKLNQYITRTQSFLQAGKPANDVLVYFPIYDAWAEPGQSLLRHFDGNAEGTTTREVGEHLLSLGYGFDFISDRQIQEVAFKSGRFNTGGGEYKVVIVPECQFIPLATMEKLVAFARDGGAVVFQGSLPTDVPGLPNVIIRQHQFDELVNSIDFSAESNNDVSVGKIGSGKVILSDKISPALAKSPVQPEQMATKGFRFVKRMIQDRTVYFVVNSTDSGFTGWTELNTAAESVIRFNPMTGESGLLRSRALAGKMEIYLDMKPEESCILKTVPEKVKGAIYTDYGESGKPVMLENNWTLQFISGGPTIPEKTSVNQLGSWTELDSDGTTYFSGTAKYITDFDAPDTDATAWELNLGEVHESAVVSVNGTTVDTLITPPYQVTIPGELLESSNTLEVAVTNLMANRIIYLEREDIHWKKFYNINFPPQTRENMGADGLFDASDWEPLPSGLIGPVSITPLKMK
ncbi:MAG: glycoside hydrolase family 2 protein [Candidatus Marinimicrobia bacterium]|nr:glycoside hydrolase family 2 protein [Candidatus Neomarinimicrobiota bacterium]MCF7828211.1 glycoside hydrolase family 2 protein [Candidatus Neomarinimicrobiota bacterium]MCF7879614.1 glycoside hydrolase family 2 protein [Candidatus Neomarinimicrobiota bacterium]